MRFHTSLLFLLILGACKGDVPKEDQRRQATSLDENSQLKASGRGQHGGNAGEVPPVPFEQIFPTETYHSPVPDERTPRELDDAQAAFQEQWASQHNATATLTQIARRSVAAVLVRIDQLQPFHNSVFARIDTRVHVTVEREYRKLPASTATIKTIIVLGGQIGDRGSHISHQPEFSLGLRYAVFVPAGYSDEIQGLGESSILSINGQDLLGASGNRVSASQFDLLLAQLGEDL